MREDKTCSLRLSVNSSESELLSFRCFRCCHDSWDIFLHLKQDERQNECKRAMIVLTETKVLIICILNDKWIVFSHDSWWSRWSLWLPRKETNEMQMSFKSRKSLFKVKQEKVNSEKLKLTFFFSKTNDIKTTCNRMTMIYFCFSLQRNENKKSGHKNLTVFLSIPFSVSSTTMMTEGVIK